MYITIEQADPRFVVRDEDFLDYATLNQEAVFTSGDLPHRSQFGKLQFITFHADDSVPSTVLEEMYLKRTEFERLYPDRSKWDKTIWRKYKSLQLAIEKYMDAGYGECVFNNVYCRKAISDLIISYDVREYDLFSFVIMPNHIHMLIREITPLPVILHKLKGNSQYIVRKGFPRFTWKHESWDTMLRNYEGLHRILWYIRSNPQQLPDDCFTLYSRRDVVLRYTDESGYPREKYF